MRSFVVFILLVFAELVVYGQNHGPIPVSMKKISDYFVSHSREKIFITTDKSKYKPGETVWFHAIVTDGNNLPLRNQSPELFVELYDSNGKPDVRQLFKLNNGVAQGDILLPPDLSKGNYFLCVYTSSTSTPEDISVSVLTIDPGYHKQWVAQTSLKDSISIAGHKNEAYLLLRQISGEICKNTTLKFRLLNGDEILETGKLKTDGNGKLTVPFTLPSKTNGDPFILELSDSKDEWKSNRYIPSGLDPVVVRFYPEGGSIIPGKKWKIGFTAFNKWGIPVDIEGTIQNRDGRMIARVTSFTRGLGMFSAEIAANEQSSLVVTGTNGQNQSFNLPVPDSEGVAISVVKNDLEYISCIPNFADNQKHSIVLTMNQDSKIFWASELEIDKSGLVKIPTENLPHGLNQLCLFSEKGDLLASRIVFVDKKQELKITIHPEKGSLATGEKMKIKVLLTNENNQPQSGNITVAVSDQFRRDATKPLIDEYMQIGTELETPFSLIAGGFKGKITNSTLLDVFLIANRFKSTRLAGSGDFNNERKQQGGIASKDPATKNSDLQISDYIKRYALKYNLLYKDSVPDTDYFANNGELFQKAPKVYKSNTIAIDNQRKMLESSSSILDVIKTIKPYSIKNNMIVFVGSENSLNYQGGALIVLDGQQMGTDISTLSGISPMDVDHINVSTNAMDIQRYTGLNSVGIIEIFLKRGSSGAVANKVELVGLDDDGFRIPGIFPIDPVQSKRDNRTTLLWIPGQHVDQTGQFEFLVTAGRVWSDFVIEVQGITTDGRAGSGTAIFSVVK